jgi:hypothetical protein
MPYRYVGRCNGSLNDLDERYERISHLTVKPMRYYLLCMLKVVSIAVDRFLHPSSRDPPETELSYSNLGRWAAHKRCVFIM